MPLSKRKEAPLDPFKRALTLATRSIACNSAVEVVFSNEPAGLFGKTARVPEPSRVPTRNEIAVIRGHADAAALSIACHDPALHAKLAPAGFTFLEYQSRNNCSPTQRLFGPSLTFSN